MLFTTSDSCIAVCFLTSATCYKHAVNISSFVWISPRILAGGTVAMPALQGKNHSVLKLATPLLAQLHQSATLATSMQDARMPLDH